MGKPVTIVSDAIQHLDSTKSAAFLQKFQADGGVKASTEL